VQTLRPDFALDRPERQPCVAEAIRFLTSARLGSLQKPHKFGLDGPHEPCEFLNKLKLVGWKGTSEFILDEFVPADPRKLTVGAAQIFLID